jgi:hypothetical protein
MPVPDRELFPVPAEIVLAFSPTPWYKAIHKLMFTKK